MSKPTKAERVEMENAVLSYKAKPDEYGETVGHHLQRAIAGTVVHENLAVEACSSAARELELLGLSVELACKTPDAEALNMADVGLLMQHIAFRLKAAADLNNRFNAASKEAS